jgi:hypothetical protein
MLIQSSGGNKTATSYKLIKAPDKGAFFLFGDGAARLNFFVSNQIIIGAHYKNPVYQYFIQFMNIFKRLMFEVISFYVITI